MAKRGGRIDPKAKRRDETHLQWRSRLAAIQETERREGEDIVTKETLAQGGLVKAHSPDQERAQTYRRRSTSSLDRLNARGVISDDQLAAAQEIAMIPERISRDVTCKSSSYGHRVDCEGSKRNLGFESLNRIRLERAYSAWRLSLPLPRGLVLDMVTEDHQLAAIAKRHHTGWRRAVVMLKDALDLWGELKREAFDAINQDDVDEVLRRIA